MISAVDTNVLLDVLVPDSVHSSESEAALSDALAQGTAVICEAVYAELGAQFAARHSLDAFLAATGIELLAARVPALYAAGQLWKSYAQRRADPVCAACGRVTSLSCPSCGQRVRPRQHVVADFMIGAHAQEQADIALA